MRKVKTLHPKKHGGLRALSLHPTNDYQKVCGPFPDQIETDKEYMSKVTKAFPEIIWIGKNIGRKNVHLHFHVDKKKDRIDSIMLDCGFMYSVSFHSKESEEEVIHPPTISSSEDTDYSEMSEITEASGDKPNQKTDKVERNPRK